jgi:hypothetical protein
LGEYFTNLAPASADTVACLLILKNKEIKAAEVAAKIMQLFPNPGTGYFSANVKVKKPGLAKISIQNYLGQVVEMKKNSLPEGESNIPFNLTIMKPGIYLLNIEITGEVINSKFIKK